MKKHPVIIYSFLIFFTLLNISDAKSQNVVPAASYCNTDGTQNFYISNPPNKTWTCDYPGVITNTGGGNCTFEPSLVAGPYPRVITIHYQNPNYTGEPATAYDPAVFHYEYVVTITNPVAVSFNVVPDVCLNDPAFDLEPFGNPTPGGVFAGPGVDAGGWFNPAVAGAGTHSLSYTYPATGCNATAYRMVTVEALPVVSLTFAPAQADVCVNDAQFVLAGGSPGGGIYSGTGVVGGTDFDPVAAGVGTHTITYTYTTPTGCIGTDTDNIIVHAIPTVKANITSDYCAGSGGGSIVVQSIDANIDYHLYNNTSGVLLSTQSGAAGTDLTFSGLLADDYYIRAEDQAAGCFDDSGIETINEIALPVVTFNLPAGDEEACLGDASFALSGGLPLGGSFSGAGVALGSFDPSTGAGSYTVTYTYNDGTCSNTATDNITVYALPVVSLAIPPVYEEVCIDEPSFALSGGLPAGGIFDIDGFVNANFDPVGEGSVPSPHTITYTYTDANGCINNATDDITVYDLPVVGIVGLNPTQCDNVPLYPFNGNNFPLPGGASASFTYTGAAGGLTDVGDGSATFDPTQTGLGTHTVTYNYTDPNGCSNSTTQGARVGTELDFINLDPHYCGDVNNVTFTYWPGVSTFPGGHTISSNPAMLTLVDNDPASTATFDPSAEVPGIYTIEYTYWDDLGCENFYSQEVVITSDPTANIADLDASYCSNSGIVNITGVPLPNGAATGTFSTAMAGLNDAGNGTATFNPSLAAIGGPVNISYTYVDDFGCTDVYDAPVTILEAPTATISGDNTICAGTSTDLLINLGGAVAPLGFDIIYTDGAASVPANGITDGTLITISPPTSNVFTISTVSYNSDNPNACTNTGNGSATIVVTPQVAITADIADVTVCENGNANFTIAATGTADLNYEWFVNAVSVQNGPSNVLVLNNRLLANDGDQVYCVVSSTSCLGTATSSTVTLNVNPNTVITGNPTSTEQCDGTSHTFSVNANGVNLAYRWEVFSGGIWTTAPLLADADYTDVFSANLQISNLDNASHAGFYRCEVTGDCGPIVYSGQAELVVNDPIVITAQPNDIQDCEDNSILFSLTATGTNLSYQWYFDDDGVLPDVALGISNTQPVNNVALGNEGEYYCEITSPCGATLLSDRVSFSLLPEVTVTNPVGGTICEGNALNLSVVGTGSNISYLWYKDGVSLGIITSNLTIDPIALADAGNYRCIVTGDCGSATSATATVVVEESVTFNSQPVDRTVCPGSDATFLVDVNGTNLTYDWQFNGITLGAASVPNYTINGAGPGDVGNYRCVISNTCGDFSSNEVQLIVNTTTAITDQPDDVNSCEGTDISFAVTANGTGNAYQWYKDGVLQAGETNQVINLNNIVNADGGNYQCVVTGVCNSVTSSTATLVADVLPAITTQPVDATDCPLTNTNITVVATGTNLVYDWFFDNIPSDVFIAQGVNSPIFNIPAFGGGNEGDYYAEITNNCGTITTNTVTRTLGATTIINTQPTNVSGCVGANANFFITMTSGSGLNYEWRLDGVALVDDFVKIIGANTPNLSINGIAVGDAGNYSCRVVGSCGSETSNSATLTVNEPVIITSDPINDEICEGGNTSFTITATGTGLAFQWFNTGGPIAGANNATYSIVGAVVGQTDTYYCEVSNGCNTEQSNSANLIVNELITINPADQPTSVTECEGSTVSFSTNAATGTTGSIINYQWQFNGANLANGGEFSGVDTKTLTISGITLANEGHYTCVITNACHAATTLAATLTVNENVDITLQPISQTGCPAEPISLVTTANGTSLSYDWFKDGAQTIPAVLNPVYDIAAFAPGDEGTYYCAITNGCGTTNTENAIITLGQNTVINADPTDATKCIGDIVTFEVDAAGTNLTYQWYKDGAILIADGRITNVDAATLSISNIEFADLGEYNCLVTGDCGTLTSVGATLTVRRPPAITTQPVSDTVCHTAASSFNVITTGDDLSYLWRLNGVDIAGETNSSIVINPVDIASDQGKYSVEISTLVCGTITSTDADLVIYDNLMVDVPAPNASACEGNNASFEIQVSGPPVIDYQWYHNGVILAEGGQYGGVKSNVLSINNVTTANAGNYFVDLNSRCGSFVSNISTLTILEDVVITIQPASFSVLAGNTANFTVVATGDVVGYRWYKDGLAMIDVAGKISGATTANLQIDNCDALDEASYTCEITSNCVDATSDAAVLTVSPASLITTHPATPVDRCEGESLTLSIVSTGTTFIWRKNGVDLIEGGDISGSDLTTLTISNLEVADQGAYTCLVDGVESSAASIVSVYQATAITNHPDNAVHCENDIVVFQVEADGDGLGYEWYKDGAAIVPAETNSTLSIVALNKLTHQGSYHCEITGTCGDLPSDPASLTVNLNTVITGQPTGNTICEGSSHSLEVDAVGDNLSYQWYKNGDLLLGANSSILLLSNALVSNSGSYTCVVSGDCGSETSNAAIMNITETTQITMHPVDREVCDGNTLSFTVAADGDITNYQWYHNGAAVGASLPSFSIAGATTADAGSYMCAVTGTCGAVANSTSASLTVNDLTVINSQPVDDNICENITTTLTFDVSGSNPNYKWYKDGLAIQDTGKYLGTTTQNLEISTATVNYDGIYSCEVTAACGDVNSNSVEVVVNPTTAITTNPTSKERCVGDNVTLTVSAVGAPDIQYLWHKDNVAMANVGNVTGADTPTLNITGVDATNAGDYYCEVSSLTCNTTNSLSVPLTVFEPLVIVSNPLNDTICEGTSTTLTIGTTGTVVSYQWYKDGVELSGENLGSLVISNAQLTDEGSYTCIITGECNNQTTVPAVVFVYPQTVVTKAPNDKQRCEGDNALFIVEADGNNLTYQWKHNSVIIAGQTNPNLTINPITDTDAGSYTCDITGTCGSITSDPGVLSVLLSPTVNVQPVDASVCQNNTGTFSINVTGADVNYQWQKNGVNIPETGNYTGTKTSELEINSVTLADEGIYRCQLVGTCGNNSTNSAILSMVDSTVIITHPDDVAIVEGTDAYFNVSASGDIINYQWQYNGADIADGADYSGTNTSLLTVNSVLPADEGAYQCIVTGSCGEIISNIANLTVHIQVSIVTNPTDKTACVGDATSFNVVATGTGLTYQWQFNGADIDGAESESYVINNVQKEDAGVYSCLVTGSYDQMNSLEAKLTVNDVISIIEQPKTDSVCESDNIILETLATGNSLVFQWRKDGLDLSTGGNISGADQSLLVVSNVSTADAGSYRCFVENTCSSILSDAAVISIDDDVAITDQPQSASKCETNSVNFSVTATGDNIKYQWYKNGVALSSGGNIGGAKDANLIVSNLTLNDAGNYSCRVYNTCSNETSANAVLTVNKATSITQQPTDYEICESQDAIFEVNAEGTNLNYQWQKNGANLATGGRIFGADESVLMIQNTVGSDEGVYHCIITGGCDALESLPASLTVNLLPDPAGAIDGDNSVCQGDENVLYVVPEIANAVTYQWTLPYGAVIAGGINTRSIQVNFANNAQSGVLYVTGKNTCGNGLASVAVPITVNQLPIADAGTNDVVCGTTTTLEANAVTGTWSIYSGDAVIVNAGLFNSDVTDIQQGDNQFIWTVTENGCTANDTVIVTNSQVDIDVEEDKVVCSKSSTLTANYPLTGAVWSVVSGSGSIPVSELTSPTATVTNLGQGVNEFAWLVNNLGCASMGIVTITNDKPNVPNGGANQIIDFSETTLDAEPTEVGTTGTWLVLSGSAEFANKNNPKTFVSGLSAGENILLWQVQRNNCILADTVIVENIMIDDPEAGANQIICIDSTKLDAIIPEVGTGEWSVKSGAATFLDKFNSQSSITNIGPGDNWLYWTVRTSGSGIAYDSVLITNYKTIEANAGPDMVTCDNYFTLMANSPVYGIGTWTLNSGSGDIVTFDDPESIIENLGQGANELKWTITNNNCISEDFVTITNNAPTLAYAGTDQILCVDSTILLPNTPTIGVGSWSIVSGAGSINGNIVTNLGPDVNTLQYTITQGSCVSTDEVSITNNQPSFPDAGYNQALCENSAVLDASQAVYGEGQWSVISGSGIFNDASMHNTTVNNIADGINTYRWTITKNECKLYDEVQISNGFVLSTAGDDVVQCSDEYQLLASNPLPGEGTWSVVGTSAAIFQNQNDPNSLVTNLSNGNNQLRWTVKNNGCESYADVIITNNKPTEALAGENQAVCAKEATLRANIPVHGTGVWTVMSGQGTFDDPSDPFTTVRNLGVGQNTIRWTITEEQCFSTDDITLTSNMPINVFAGNDQIACSDTAELNAVPPTIGTGNWSIISGQGTFDNAFDNKTIIRNLGKGQNIFKWTVSSSDCHVPDTVIITSNIPTPAVAGADQIICNTDTRLAANQPAIGTGEWVLVSGSAIIESPNNPNSQVTGIALGNTTLRWTINESGCYSHDEMVLTNNQPSTPFAGYDTEICADSVRLFATPPEIGTGFWSLVSGDAVILDIDTNQTVVENIRFGENTFRWTVTNVNCVLYDDVKVTNNLEYVYAGDDMQVNSPDVQLIANKPAKGVGLWEVSASPASIATPNSFDTKVFGLGAGTNIFTWTITNNGCVSSDDIVVDYVVMPVADFDPSAITGCPPMLVNFVNTSIGGAPYSWDLGDGNTSTDQSVLHIYDEPGTYKVTMAATAPLGLTITKDTFITVYERPVANFDIAPKTVYIPGEYISCYNYSTDASESVWFFGDGNYKDEFSPTYTYEEEGIYDITLKVYSDEGCVDSMTLANIIEVLPRSDFFFPTAFTPNLNGPSGGEYDPQDRSNDVFYPIIVDGELDEYEMLIYNRNGVLLFQTTDVKIGWDGYYKNELLPKDVYVYLVRGKYNNGQVFNKTGSVLLIVKEN